MPDPTLFGILGIGRTLLNLRMPPSLRFAPSFARLFARGPKPPQVLNSRKLDFEALWGLRTRKWGPQSKIRFPTLFLDIKRHLKKITILVWGHPLRSLLDLKNPCFCHYGQIAIRYHSRGPKQGSKMTKIEISFFCSQKKELTGGGVP